MIDWWMVGSNWLAKETGRRRRELFTRSWRVPFNGGMVLTCLGWGLAQATRWTGIRFGQGRKDPSEVSRVARRAGEYSGATAAPSFTGAGQKPPSSSDVQTLTPQIDRTFIDRIVELSAANTTFRQDITQQMIEASVEAVRFGSIAEHYRQLLASLKAGADSTLSGTDVTERLAGIVGEAKELARRFKGLSDEFSRVSLRAGPSMYRIERPPEAVTLKSFSLRAYGLLVLGALFATPFLMAIGCLAYDRYRKFASGPPQATSHA